MDDKKKHSCHARHLQAGDCAVERVLATATATANRRRRRAAAVQPLGVTTRTMEPRVHVTGTSPPPLAQPSRGWPPIDWPLTLVARQQKPFLLGSWPVSPSAGSMDQSPGPGRAWPRISQPAISSGATRSARANNDLSWLREDAIYAAMIYLDAWRLPTRRINPPERDRSCCWPARLSS
jgi:hypothetical protein